MHVPVACVPDRGQVDAVALADLDDARQQLGSDLLKQNERADLLTGHRLNEATILRCLVSRN